MSPKARRLKNAKAFVLGRALKFQAARTGQPHLAKIGQAMAAGAWEDSATPPTCSDQRPEAEAKPQLVLPGIERISNAELAKRRAGQPLKASVVQKPADEGLFGTGGKQTELEAAIAKAPPPKR